MLKQYDNETLKKLQQVELEILLDIKRMCEKYDIGYSITYGSLIGVIRHKGFIPWDDDIDLMMFRDEYEKFEKIFDKELGDKYKLMTPLREKGYSGNVIKVMKKNTKFIYKQSMKQKCDQGIFIDIFIWDRVSKNEKKFKKQAKKVRFLAMLLFLAGTPYPEINIGGVVGILSKVICFVTHYALKLWPNRGVHLFNMYTKECMKSNNEDTSIYTVYQVPDVENCIVDRNDVIPYIQGEFEGEMVNIPHEYDKILKNMYGEYMELPPEDKRVNHAADIIDFGE